MTEKIVWTSEFEIGIASIDGQHKRLVEYIGEMQDALEAENSLLKAKLILVKIVAYTKAHFAHEEKLFEKHGYPLNDDHVQHHNGLIDQVLSYKKKLDDGDPSVPEGLLNFLITWLKNHILVEDKKYVAHFKECGVY